MNSEIIKKINAIIAEKPNFDSDEFSRLNEQIINKLKSIHSIFGNGENPFELSLEILKQENEDYFLELNTENYPTSFTNPSFCMKVFGTQNGQVFSWFYHYFLKIRELFFLNDYDEIKHRLTILSQFQILMNLKTTSEKWSDLQSRAKLGNIENSTSIDLKRKYNVKKQPFLKILTCRDPQKGIYLYGKPVLKGDIFLEEFYRKYDEKWLHALADQIVKGYLRGFASDNKDISTKTSVQIFYSIGQEKLIKCLTDKLQKFGLDPLYIPAYSSKLNSKLELDYSKVDAMYLNQQYVEKVISAHKMAYEENQVNIASCSGRIGLLRIDLPCEEVAAKNLLEYTMQQLMLKESMQRKIASLKSAYSKSSETSYTIIALATPEITNQTAAGDYANFEAIFNDIVEVNLLDSIKYEKIQHLIIQTMDLAEKVQIRGNNGNETDLIVQMQKIVNRGNETNFLNGGATLNIPAGELFTTPKLTGTCGTLHINKTFLKGKLYKNLKLRFLDGIVVKYDCSNFLDQEKNRNYIKENLFNNNETLPMGEFAIGTNTQAFKIARKHNLENTIPILITEKTGPHFAIGDPCFARGEEHPVFNLIDGKEVTARENELTAQRHTKDVYSNCHTDITIPYDELGSLTVITKDDQAIDVLRDGLFVLPGAEILNEPLII